MIERGPASRLLKKFSEKGSTKKVCRKRFMIEGLLVKVCWKRSVEEGLLEKVCRRRSAREGPREKVLWKRGMSMEAGQSERGLWLEKWSETM